MVGINRARSLLFVPGNRPEMIAKIPNLRPDIAVVDLEDAVTVEDKRRARDVATTAVSKLDAEGIEVIVRLNGPDTPWFEEDLNAVAGLGDTGVLLPKYEHRSQVARIRSRLGCNVPVLVGLETARGVADCRDLLGAPIQAAYFGAEDFIADMGGVRTRAGAEVHSARSAVVLAARLAGVIAIDQAVVAIKDEEHFIKEAQEAVAMGYTGKICVHPAQVNAAHRVFTPTESQIRHARAVMTAVAAGVGMMNGTMVDGVHARMAAMVLNRAGVSPDVTS